MRRSIIFRRGASQTVRPRNRAALGTECVFFRRGRVNPPVPSRTRNIIIITRCRINAPAAPRPQSIGARTYANDPPRIKIQTSIPARPVYVLGLPPSRFRVRRRKIARPKDSGAAGGGGRKVVTIIPCRVPAPRRDRIGLTPDGMGGGGVAESGFGGIKRGYRARGADQFKTVALVNTAALPAGSPADDIRAR